MPPDFIRLGEPELTLAKRCQVGRSATPNKIDFEVVGREIRGCLASEEGSALPGKIRGVLSASNRAANMGSVGDLGLVSSIARTNVCVRDRSQWVDPQSNVRSLRLGPRNPEVLPKGLFNQVCLAYEPLASRVQIGCSVCPLPLLGWWLVFKNRSNREFRR
jgi:hypothetical protein